MDASLLFLDSWEQGLTGLELMRTVQLQQGQI
jgi:hypothetical protein